MKNRVGGEWVVKSRTVVYAHGSGSEGGPENSCSKTEMVQGRIFYYKMQTTLPR
jgi:hypothetical protein